ncbi:helix-turn-helix domain-containing protein [Nocardia otitidiscaviarum]|uniref:helix-turn-helix domain-containing protein n=1 Tax=Nocardia otitidiscaviarum TaxID=1823 RepID=UPI001E30F479|nr:helix-turn-helix domain-containing protein [Nocardia otitidiscaviarum]
MPLDTGWWLERNDRRILFARHGTTALFADTGTAAVSEHGHPAWKLVLPVRGERVEVVLQERGPTRRTGRSGATAVAASQSGRERLCRPVPRCAYTAASLRTDRGDTVRRRSPPRRPGHQTRCGFAPRPPRGTRRAPPHVRPATSPDPRITLALAHFDDRTTLTDLAREVGLSAPRLRALVQERVGVPLATLRRWYRLRNALTALRGGTIADAAADAGFADHAHLARTARDMLGRSPSSLTRPNAAS